ncbi:hypothetical protein INR49_001492 [Caranx melampygus]|nr:hypothetical protein INR49_001492 [Caranx melampygus]
MVKLPSDTDRKRWALCHQTSDRSTPPSAKDGSGLGRPQDEHSRLEQEWRLSGYNAHKCGTTGLMSTS